MLSHYGIQTGHLLPLRMWRSLRGQVGEKKVSLKYSAFERCSMARGMVTYLPAKELQAEPIRLS